MGKKKEIRLFLRTCLIEAPTICIPHPRLAEKAVEKSSLYSERPKAQLKTYVSITKGWGMEKRYWAIMNSLYPYDEIISNKFF